MNRFVIVYALNMPSNPRVRVGFSVSKRLGKAVSRNRIKRRLKEAWRQIDGEVELHADVVVVARGGCIDAEFDELVGALREAAERVGLFRRRIVSPKEC